jgi:hypothetical protein
MEFKKLSNWITIIHITYKHTNTKTCDAVHVFVKKHFSHKYQQKYMKAARLLIHANLHKNFENVFKSKIL